MKSSKKILAAGVLSAFLLAPVPSYATDVFVNDQPLAKSHEVLLQDGRSFVPLRAISEALGCEVGWNGAEQEITVQKNPLALKLHLGSKAIEKSVNGESSTLTVDVPPLLKENRTYVPLRYVSEMLGLDVKWNEKDQSISIRDKAIKAEEKAEVKAEKTEKKDNSELKEDKAKKTDKTEVKEIKPKTSHAHPKTVKEFQAENSSINDRIKALVKVRNEKRKKLNELKDEKREYIIESAEKLKKLHENLKPSLDRFRDQLNLDEYDKFEKEMEEKFDKKREKVKKAQKEVDQEEEKIENCYQELRANSKALEKLK